MNSLRTVNFINSLTLIFMNYRKKCLVAFYKKGGEILAYWPYVDFSNTRANTKQGYAHIGQHCAVHSDYIRGARLATLPEYMPLLLEIISIGYNDLQICNVSRKLPSQITEMDDILKYYLECLLWVNEEDLKAPATEIRISQGLDYLVRAFVILFNSKFGRSLENILTSDQIGHAMYLTQHRHGAGFLDFSEIPAELEKQIADFLYSFGELYPYIKNKTLCVDSRW